MTIEEVLRALVDGKTVRAEDGSWIVYVGMREGTVVYSSDPNNLINTSFSFDTSYTYSIYEPPKPKKRYWQWKLCDPSGRWIRNDYYTDEEGKTTGSGATVASFTTAIERIRIEDDYIEV